jgi:fibronectin type 3 domain-containing protein
LNLGVSGNRFRDFLADPGSRSFSRFYTNVARSRYYVGSVNQDEILGDGTPGAKNGIFFQVFPMFVPSLSWQNDRFDT